MQPVVEFEDVLASGSGSVADVVEQAEAVDAVQECEFPEVLLAQLHRADRTVAYATAGLDSGAPVLFFYPLGGNRRMLACLHKHALQASLRLICVNRPGKGSTSDSEEGDPRNNVATASADATAVLDALSVSQASLLFMCAGTPFALAFASQMPSRCTGRAMGVASWISPADSAATKLLYRIGVHLPMIGPLVGKTVSSMNGSLSSLPTSLVVKGFKSKLSADEQSCFEQRFGESDIVGRQMAWIREECRGEGRDVAALLTAYNENGIDLRAVTAAVQLFHGSQDTMVPLCGAEWLQGQLPSATLHPLSAGTHEGTIFCLHPELVQALATLAPSV